MKQLELVVDTATPPTPYSDWFASGALHPPVAGAYECRTVTPGVVTTVTYFRWWNPATALWSYPIESGLDDEFAKPADDLFPMLADETLMPFEWRGYKDDPDPL